MKARTERAVKEALADMLDVLSYKIRHGAMSASDARALLDIIMQGGGIRATVKELAGFYNQSEDNVRHIIHRNLLNQAILGNLSENPQKVQIYSAPQPCGCPGSCA